MALHLGLPNIKEALSIYDHLSWGNFIFSLSSMMLSGFKSAHLVSNYSISIGDSLESIYLAVNNVGKILSKGGEVSINVSELRGEGSEIRKTNGTATGPIPMLKVFD